jgi:alpha-L-rhamnosidase
MRNIAVILTLVMSLTVSAQFGNFNRENQWDASWVTVPGAGETDPGLYLFRKTLALDARPETFKVYVSGDNRFKLYVNEQLVSIGPALGDISHWNYETLDLAPYLKAGENIVAAEIWNEGDLKAVSQFSLRTGFILQGTDEATKVLNTNDSWKCVEDESYTPIRQRVRGYYAAGAGDQIDMNYKIKGWEKLSYNDSSWQQAKPVFERSARGMGFRVSSGWTLIPSILPQRELIYQRLLATRKSEGVSVPENFPAEKASFKVPANTTAKILLDQTFYTNAYPTLIFSGGKNSTITITYAEGLYDENGAKNNRNEIEGKTISGRQDMITPDGSGHQNFTALNWRTYRYIELKVETKDAPLTIEDFYGTFTGYPFKLNAKITVNNPEIDKLLEIGWRTARSCAVETYMDCPYYERLQYIGDARIQLFVSYFNSGDDRLAKNALNLMDNSRQRDGYTLSRYPDTQNQVIATYSMWYVCMLYDYLLYGSDPEFLKDKLLGARQILNYFITYLDTGGSLKNVPGWNFTDWAEGWRMGTGPVGEDGSSAVMDLQLLLALQAAIELEKHEGSEEFVTLYGSLAKKISETMNDKYWDPSRRLFADTPGKDKFSQHTNSMAILAGLVDGQQATEIGKLMLSDTTLTQASIYFKYYLHLALAKAGLGDGYLGWLDIWRKNIALGMTTWGETSEVETTRSDCHAWGASPNIEFFRIILGIESNAPYFSKVKIEPHLGSIEQISGEMPHPNGKISVQYDLKGKTPTAEIELPDNVEGTFIWKGKSYVLNKGKNTLTLINIIQ